jgi:hypothetical protein
MHNNVRKSFLFTLFITFLLQGCVATQSFPTVARAGDTITLAVGSPDGMTKANTTAHFISDVDGSTIVLPIRSIIRLRPDQTSQTALFDGFLDAQDNYTVHSQWLTVLVIDLPEGLTIGAGHIDINTSATYGTLPVGVNDIPVSIEIIEGTGVRNDFNYNNNFGGAGAGNLSALESLPQAIFRTPNLAWTQVLFAAAEVKINLPLGSVPSRAIRVVADDYYTKNAQDQVQMSWSRIDDELTVNFISPSATMEPLQLRFSVVLSPGNSFLVNPEPSVIGVKFYDLNGDLMTIEGNGVPAVNEFTIGIE